MESVLTQEETGVWESETTVGTSATEWEAKRALSKDMLMQRESLAGCHVFLNYWVQNDRSQLAKRIVRHQGVHPISLVDSFTLAGTADQRHRRPGSVLSATRPQVARRPHSRQRGNVLPAPASQQKPKTRRCPRTCEILWIRDATLSP